MFYLDWLLDHKGEFTLLAMSRIGQVNQDDIEWDNARLLCIASEFTKYDEYAVQQINRNIELIRYRKFDNEILLFELVNSTSAEVSPKSKTRGTGRQTTVLDLLDKMGKKEKDLYETLKAFISALGDDVQEKTTKFYIAYKRLSNFACFEFHPSNEEIVIFLKLNPKVIQMEEGFSRDVSNIGHYGTGNLEIKINSDDDVVKAQPLIMRAYEES